MWITLSNIRGLVYRSPSTDDQPGVGIGLYLAREIVRSQRGYIKVTSKKGEGSQFSVFLPSADCEDKIE